MAQLDGNSKVVKMLINNDLQNNVNGSGESKVNPKITVISTEATRNGEIYLEIDLSIPLRSSRDDDR
jgi:uncharacterized surface protein with fasciclin (FAS1) repeats